jgi:hypothetical protein
VSTYTADQITEAIALAVRAHDMPAVVSLLKRLAVTDPVQAQAVYDTLKLGLEVTGTDVSGL